MLKRCGLFGLTACWLIAVAVGLSQLWNFESEAGQAATPPARWPSDSHVARVAGEPTLVMLVHPHCPCSRASLEEIDRLMAQSSESVSLRLLFVRPPGVAETWEQTDTWRRASAIPRAEVTRDDDGVEAARFGAATSGQVMLYGADGELLFSGGITPSRGHEGDNHGRSTILSLLRHETPTHSQSAVFGCPLQRSDRSAARALEAHAL